ncbi:dNTP triphosphohydrolase [Halorubrum ezzemoulense]|uniref:deoxyguanosinetriphosphate triphosphohydrolase family protein n=1 Tax=Halorubrum ezzemoulense TaxID=337243 RepID=UPI00232B9036|nr:dNTP triphosphohydrolase [Halorubrum ezzemoulense]MDB2225938.1 dNTP triphosphohydrolase [Halorubrum ezzemoulense]
MTVSLTTKQRYQRRQDSSEGLFRTPSRRDRDRVRFSREFRRLKTVTQVAHAGESYLYHDRLSHSLKVAQVASSLVKIFHERHNVSPEVTAGINFPSENDKLGRFLDPYVVEAAAHAHDIGHPPFGHAGENELNRLVKHYSTTEEDIAEIGFEGNAQSFRVVTRLAAHREANSGLNVTRATLNGMLKYPWSRGDDAIQNNDEKWGYYPTDTDAFEWARDGLDDYRTSGPLNEKRQTLEAQIMDYADDLTYAVHDLEDFYRSGIIPLHEIFREALDEVDKKGSTGNLNKYTVSSRDHLDDFEDYLETDSNIDPNEVDVAEIFSNFVKEFDGSSKALVTPFEGTDAERRELNEFTSQLISKFLEANRKKSPKAVYLEPIPGDKDGFDLNTDEYKIHIELLKALTEFYVISNPTLMQQQHGQKRVLSELFESLYGEADPKKVTKSAIPMPYRDRLKNLNESGISRTRLVADLISSLTEKQTLRLHKRLCGDSPGSLQNSIIG